MKYRKKPVIVEAEQFYPDRPLPFRDRGPIVITEGATCYVITIHDEQANLEPGDWVILEPRGALRAYPCKPDIFALSYEVAE